MKAYVVSTEFIFKTHLTGKRVFVEDNSFFVVGVFDDLVKAERFASGIKADPDYGISKRVGIVEWDTETQKAIGIFSQDVWA